MSKSDQFLYDNYSCWKTGVLVFMWQINCHIQKIVRVDETTYKIGNFFDVIDSQIAVSNLLFSNKNCSYRRGLHWQINKTCHKKIARVDGSLSTRQRKRPMNTSNNGLQRDNLQLWLWKRDGCGIWVLRKTSSIDSTCLLVADLKPLISWTLRPHWLWVLPLKSTIIVSLNFNSHGQMFRSFGPHQHGIANKTGSGSHRR